MDDPAFGRVPRALKPWRTEAYLKYVGARQGAGNEGIRLKANRYRPFSRIGIEHIDYIPRSAS
jgi:hypothetical protein